MAVITVIQRKCDTLLWRHVQHKKLQIHLRAFIAFMPHISLDDFRRHVVGKQMHGQTVPQQSLDWWPEAQIQSPLPGLCRSPIASTARLFSCWLQTRGVDGWFWTLPDSSEADRHMRHQAAALSGLSSHPLKTVKYRLNVIRRNYICILYVLHLFLCEMHSYAAPSVQLRYSGSYMSVIQTDVGYGKLVR